MDIQCTVGFQPKDTRLVAILYNETFGQYFKLAVPNNAKRAELIQHILDPRHCVVAYSDSHLLGVLGFGNAKGTLVRNPDLGILIQVLGFIPALWASFIILFFSRRAKANELLIAGMAIDPQCRGLGVGQALLQCLKHYAMENNYSRIRIELPGISDVGAKMFMKQGFVLKKISFASRLRQIIYFKKVTGLVLDL